MGRYCEFCKQAYEEGRFWEHIGEQHPISCANVQNSYAQYKDNALKDDEMYTRIAYHLFSCPACGTLVPTSLYEPICDARAKAAMYFWAIQCGKTVAEFESYLNAACDEGSKYMNAQDVGPEVYRELKRLLKQLNLLFESVLKRKNIIYVEKVSTGAEAYRLGARLKVEVVCPPEERSWVMEIFGAMTERWADIRGFIPNEGSFCEFENEEKTVGYIGVVKV